MGVWSTSSTRSMEFAPLTLLQPTGSFLLKGRKQDIARERRLARARNAGDRDQAAERNA
jgi:hypothetical protein